MPGMALKRSVEHERVAEMSQQQGQGHWLPLHLNAFDLMCHKMMHSWQLPLYCTALRNKGHSLFPAHKCSHIQYKKTAICSAICQDHLYQPLTCGTQSQDKMGLGNLSLFVFAKQNVNNTRCPGEWLKLNTSLLSVCLVSDPFWCHVVPLKLWMDQGFLSSVCSAAVMQQLIMNYTNVLPQGVYVCASAVKNIALTCICGCRRVCVRLNMCTSAGKWLLILLLALCTAPWVTCGIKSVSVGWHDCDNESVRVILIKHQSCLAFGLVDLGDTHCDTWNNK